MSFGFGGAGSGIASGFGDIGASTGSSWWNSYLAHKRDVWAYNRQLWMMANAHQIEVADLKAAGLNPILSGMGGSGASASSVSNTAGPAGASGFASGAQLGRTVIAELDALKAQAAASRANAAASLAAADETRRRADLELGKPGSVSVIDPKTGQRLGGGRVPGLRELETTANVEYLKQRAAEVGFGNVRNAIEAGVYDKAPMLVPAEKVLEAAGKLPRVGVSIQKGGKK